VASNVLGSALDEKHLKFGRRLAFKRADGMMQRRNVSPSISASPQKPFSDSEKN
jgi:hypothetical protein